MSERIKKARRRHMLELLAVMGVYLLAVLGVTALAKNIENGALLAVMALAPAALIAAACYVFYRFYQRMDERQQRIHANAAAVTLMVAVVGATALGFLKSFAVLVFEDDFVWFTAFLIVVWGLARRLMGDDC